MAHKKWHNKHIATKWGVAVLVVLLLLFIYFISVHGQNQEYQSQISNASTVSASDAKYIGTSCTGYDIQGKKVLQGKCEPRSTYACNTYYNSGLCPGSKEIQCCINTSVSCSVPGQGEGTCHNTTNNPVYTNKTVAQVYGPGKFYSNYCPGPNDVKCYVPSD